MQFGNNGSASTGFVAANIPGKKVCALLRVSSPVVQFGHRASLRAVRRRVRAVQQPEKRKHREEVHFFLDAVRLVDAAHLKK